MANLKLIKVTGSPFCSTLYGCIGIQVDDNNFNVIKGGGLNTQSSYSGCGWEYATTEEIAENWKLIYPHWTPEPGDRVIITQDYGNWTNQRGTIVEASSSKGYYRVKRKEGNLESFDYTCQMILAPYNEIKVESKETTMTKFKIGDRVQCINKSIPGYLKTGTVRETAGANVGVEFDEYMSGHTLQGQCTNGYGWYIEPKDLDIVLSTKPKEETVIVRFLTEQEFKDKDLWAYTYPKGWNSDGHMNEYLGQSVVIPKSIIESDGTFRYQDWTFKVTDYIITEGVSSRESIPTPVIDTKPEKPPRRFKVGDKVSYKSVSECEGRYYFGGLNQVGFVGTVLAEYDFMESKGCYQIKVSSKGGLDYTMLESEFYEYDGTAPSSKPTEPTKPEPKFFVGKPVTYKSVVECGGYHFGGECHKLFVGTVKSIQHYVEEKGCYAIKVTCRDSFDYTMLESEFEEYDSSFTHVPPVDIHAKGITISSSTSSAIWDPKSAYIGSFTLSVDPLDSYKQVPITMKAKPKSKLQVI